jgi:hypothetical protein
MVEIKAVKDPAPDPKAGKPRVKSGVASPYYDLEQSIVVASTIHDKGGGACSREQLAPLLKYSGVKNGGFLTRVSAAKMFGLIEESGDVIRLTQRAQTILSPVMPVDADRAKVDAFLSVELFGKVYEQFKGQTLPAEVGLKNLLEKTYQIVPDRVVPAIRIMMDSADAAGFFRSTGNRTRMVMPILNGGGGAAHAEAAPQHEEVPRDPPKPNGGKNGDGLDGDPPGIHPAFVGLLRELPKAGTIISAKKRKALTDAFKATIDFLYPEPDEPAGGTQ